MEFGIRLSEIEYKMLMDFMKNNNIKSKGQAIRKCIHIATNLETRNNLLLDMNDKLNRLMYRENLQKKLLEQLFANLVFRKNYFVKDDNCLKNFYEENNKFINKIFE